MTARVIQFDDATRRVTQDRGKTYGPPSVDFDRAARLKAVVAECKDARIRHALEMICVKMARLIQTPGHLDSWIDIAGYARTGVMVLDEVEARPHPLAGDPIEEQTFGPVDAAAACKAYGDAMKLASEGRETETPAGVDDVVRSPGLTIRKPEADTREWDYERGRWYVAPKAGDRVKALGPIPERGAPGVIRAELANIRMFKVEFARHGWYWMSAHEFKVLEQPNA